ncbi:DHH family phosphoesterase [bacterium]|nr:DHH family phosphoesterase [bacterium]
MLNTDKFISQLQQLEPALATARRVLITAPGNADGDSVGSQLALQRMIRHRFPQVEVTILNDEALPGRYRFLPDVDTVQTPETYEEAFGKSYDVAFIVDGGIDRAGRVRPIFEKAKTQVFIDHHQVSADYPYSIKIVDPHASSNTELLYYLSQSPFFETPLDRDFCEQIYLGLVFDTGFFRHSNTTPESMELAAKLLRTGFDFTRVGERGMLERSFCSLHLLSETLSRAKLIADGRVIWSSIPLKSMEYQGAECDDREGIIDHLFLTVGIQVAVLFYELKPGLTKISLRSHGSMDVAALARRLTVRGGGHRKAAGGLFEMSVENTQKLVLGELEKHFEAAGLSQ